MRSWNLVIFCKNALSSLVPCSVKKKQNQFFPKIKFWVASMKKIFLSEESFIDDIICDENFFCIDSFFAKKLDFCVSKSTENSDFFPVDLQLKLENFQKSSTSILSETQNSSFFLRKASMKKMLLTEDNGIITLYFDIIFFRSRQPVAYLWNFLTSFVFSKHEPSEICKSELGKNWKFLHFSKRKNWIISRRRCRWKKTFLHR